MIEYLYFVKFENDRPFDNPFDWEEDVFETFDEAKEFAKSNMSSHPEIHQTEIVRNDFGECVDSRNIGLVWSWQDEMSDIPNDEEMTFTKDETFGISEIDKEFTDDDITFETDCIIRKPVPEGMSIRDLIEAMEENEDEVECAWCNEIFPKDDCTHTEHNGWLCDECSDEIVECTWCEELYPQSDCRYEVNLGWLCHSCVGAIKSRGERLTFVESACKEAVAESYIPIETVDLDYDKLTIMIQGPKRDVDDWDEVEYTDSYTYCVKKGDVALALWEEFLAEEDVADVPGGFDALEDDKAWNAFLEKNFDELFDKYYDELCEYFKDDARTAFENEFTWDEYQASKRSWNESCYNESLVEGMYDFENLVKDAAAAKASILDGLRSEADVADYIKNNTIAVPYKYKNAQSYSGIPTTDGNIIDFNVRSDGKIELTIKDRSGRVIFRDLEQVIKNAPKSNTKTVLMALRDVARELNKRNRPGIRARRDAAVLTSVFNTLEANSDVAEELKNSIKKIEYKIPLTGIYPGDFGVDKNDEYLTAKAEAKLDAIYNDFLKLDFANDAIDAGIVANRSSIEDTNRNIETCWAPAGYITFKYPIKKLSAEAQNLIKDAKVVKNTDTAATKLETSTTTCCYRLANALIKYFDNDVLFYEKDKEVLTASVHKSMLEELEDADSYSKRLTMCPECGETSYDLETGFCISCGFN